MIHVVDEVNNVDIAYVGDKVGAPMDRSSTGRAATPISRRSRGFVHESINIPGPLFHAEPEEGVTRSGIRHWPKKLTPPIMAVVESNQISEAPAVEATSGAGRGRPGYSQSRRDPVRVTPIAERLADEAPLAVGAVLFRAHDAARHLENLLELEAVDPRIAELMRDAKRVRKSIAALLVDVAIDGSEITS